MATLGETIKLFNDKILHTATKTLKMVSRRREGREMNAKLDPAFRVPEPEVSPAINAIMDRVEGLGFQEPLTLEQAGKVMEIVMKVDPSERPAEQN